jgi:hypothetical protein
MRIHVYARLLQVIHILPCTGHLYYAIDRIKRMETFRQTVVTGFCKYEKRVTIMRSACSSAVVTPGKRAFITIFSIFSRKVQTFAAQREPRRQGA